MTHHKEKADDGYDNIFAELFRCAYMELQTGRIERQGNENPEVDIFRYVTDKSFDAYLYQILKTSSVS